MSPSAGARWIGVAWPLLVLGIAILVFIVGASSGIYTTGVRILALVVGWLFLVGWLLVAARDAAWRPRSGLMAAFPAALIAFGLTGLLAPVPRLALDYLAYAVLLVALYLLLVQLWHHEAFARRLGALCVLLTGGIGVLYLVVVVARWVGIWAELGRFVVPPLRPGYEGLWFGNPNALAPVLVLLYLTGIAYLGLATRRRRILFGALGALVAVDVLLTGSRGAWLGIAIALVTFAGLTVTRRDARQAMRRAMETAVSDRRARWLALAVTLGAVVLLVGAAPALASRLGDQAAETRTVFWAASLRMFAEHPLSGVGPGAWAPFRPAFTSADELDYYIPHAHDLPLHVLSEMGLIGVGAAVIVAIIVGRLVLLALRSPNGTVRRAGLVAAVAIAFVLGQHLVDEYVHQPAVLFAIALPIAKLDAEMLGERGATGGRSMVLTLVMLVAVTFSAAAALRLESVALGADQGAAAADAGDWSRALTLEETAVGADPMLAPYRLALATSLVHENRLDDAAAQLRVATALDDYPQSWLLLAAVETRLGHGDAAAVALDRALRLGDQQPAITVAAASMLLDVGRTQEAATLLAKAFVAAPTLASDAFWQASGWAGVRDGALEIALADPDRAAAAAIALELGDGTLASEAADEVPGRSGQALRLAASAIQGDRNAFDQLHAMAIAQPFDPTVVSLCLRTAELSASSGRLPAASCDGAGTPDSYAVIRVAAPPHRQSLPGPDAPFHAIYAYRRTIPFDVIAPWLPHLVAVRPAG